MVALLLLANAALVLQCSSGSVVLWFRARVPGRCCLLGRTCRCAFVEIPRRVPSHLMRNGATSVRLQA
jgi:hypothetical protein